MTEVASRLCNRGGGLRCLSNQRLDRGDAKGIGKGSEVALKELRVQASS